MKSNWLSAVILLTFQVKSSKYPLEHPFESVCHKSVLAITAFYIQITSTQLKFRLFGHIPDVV
jgi:DNA-directed RNA polymerase subunit L